MIKPLPKSITYAVLSVFGLLLLGAIFFYKQRMFFVDPCFVAFEIINTHQLVITEHRYGAFITQIVPLISSLLHLPLSLILLLYSASFYLFFISVCLLLVFKFKQYSLALLMIFYFTLFVSDVYFWPNNEVHQGIAWMFLFFGLQFNNVSLRRSFFFHAVSVSVAFLAIFSHFIVMLPMTFLWILFAIDTDRVKSNKNPFIFYSGILLIMMTIKFILGSQGWYDGEKLKGVTNLSVSSVLSAFSSGHLESFAKLVLKNYWITLLILLGGIWSLFRYKKLQVLILTLAFLLAYLVLLGITFPEGFGREFLFYMESQWMGMAIILAAPFVFYFLPQLKEREMLGLVTGILLVRLIYIGLSFPIFNERLSTLQNHVDIVKSSGSHKVIIENTPELQQKYLMTWGLPVESLMLSALKDKDDPVTFKNIEKSAIKEISRVSFYSSFRIMDMNELNSYYFKLDSIQNYIYTSFEELKQ